MSARSRFRKRPHRCPNCTVITTHRVIERDPRKPNTMTLRCTQCGRVCRIQKKRDIRNPTHLRLHGHRFRMNEAYSRENEMCTVCGKER